MKQILTLAGAALIGFCAAADDKTVALPKGTTFNTSLQRTSVPQTVKSARRVDNVRLQKSAINGLQLNRVAKAEEVNDELVAQYMNPPMGCFYVGTTPDGVRFPAQNQDSTYVNFGFGGCNNKIPFVNNSIGAASYEWAYAMKTINDDTMVEYTSEDEHLLIPVGPFTQIESPILTAFKGKDFMAYENPYVVSFLFAPSLSNFGVVPSEIYIDFPEDLKDVFGLTTCPVNVAQSGSIITSEFSINHNAYSTSTYGTPTIWINTVNSMAEQSNCTAKNTRVSKICASLPAQNSAYMLTEIWGSFGYIAKDDVVLNIDIVPVDEDGMIYINNVIAKATATLPKTESQDEIATYVLDELVESVDAEGFPIDAPVTITSEAMLMISGLDDPNLVAFYPVFNAGTQVEKGVDSSIYFADNACIVLESDLVSKTDPTKAEPKMFLFPTSALAYEGDTEGMDLCLSNLSLSYDIIFTTPINEDGETLQAVTIDVAGGEAEAVFEIVPNFDLKALIDEGLVTATTNDDWFEWSVTPETITPEQGSPYIVNHVAIKAPALPDDLRGRRAAVFFEGMGMYFPVIVTQGEVAGIDNVQAAQKVSGIYDLQGRRIAAPAKGFYIEVNNGKATKRIAR